MALRIAWLSPARTVPGDHSASPVRPRTVAMSVTTTGTSAAQSSGCSGSGTALSPWECWAQLNHAPAISRIRYCSWTRRTARDRQVGVVPQHDEAVLEGVVDGDLVIGVLTNDAGAPVPRGWCGELGLDEVEMVAGSEAGVIGLIAFRGRGPRNRGIHLSASDRPRQVVSRSTRAGAGCCPASRGLVLELVTWTRA